MLGIARRIRRPLRTATLAVVLAGMSMIAANRAAATPTGFTYSLSGDYLAPVIVSCGDTCQDAFYGGDFTCETCTGAPSGATFSLSLSPTDPYSPSCTFKQGTGDLAISWSDTTTSAASLSIRRKDSKSYALKGKVNSGTLAGYDVTGWVSQPSDPYTPCDNAPFTGSIRFVPPNPI